jgi:hypothetical protein
MKTIKQIEEESRKIIILANNPEAKSYGEALEMELGLNCEIIVNNIRVNNDLRIILDLDTNSSGKDWNFITRTYDNANRHREIRRVEIKKIIGKPLTISRVLIAASNLEATYYPASNGLKIGIFNHDEDEEKEFLAMWDLTKEILEEQTEEVQRAIHKLLKHD